MYCRLEPAVDLARRSVRRVGWTWRNPDAGPKACPRFAVDSDVVRLPNIILAPLVHIIWMSMIAYIGVNSSLIFARFSNHFLHLQRRQRMGASLCSPSSKHPGRRLHLCFVL